MAGMQRETMHHPPRHCPLQKGGGISKEVTGAHEGSDEDRVVKDPRRKDRSEGRVGVTAKKEGLPYWKPTAQGIKKVRFHQLLGTAPLALWLGRAGEAHLSVRNLELLKEPPNYFQTNLVFVMPDDCSTLHIFFIVLWPQTNYSPFP